LSRLEKIICYCLEGKKWVSATLERPLCFKSLRIIKKLLLIMVVIFSPFIIWLILSINRELIVIMANSQWFLARFPALFATVSEHVNTYEFASGFNEAALGGLLTLFGVIVTVWYYHITRIQEVTEKRLFVIDELVQELKKNRKIILELENSKSGYVGNSTVETAKDGLFHTEAWHKLGADVALLPRRIHMRLSVLYGCLGRCTSVEDYMRHKATIERVPGLISDLHRFRTSLSKKDMIT